MVDEKDLEIARLQGRLEAIQEQKRGKGIDPGRVLAWIVLGALGLFLAAWAIGAALPEETYEQKAAKLAAQINARCDIKWTKTEEAADQCRMREFQTRGLPE